MHFMAYILKSQLLSLGILGLIFLSLAHCAPITPPDIRTTDAVLLCVDCEQEFDPAEHEKILKGLLNNAYIGELRKALYWQDIVHQFQSKAHFDNCDFDSAIGYIDSLLSEVQEHVFAAQRAQSTRDESALQAAARGAFFSIGQALHAIQDFYAHSNYVELTKHSVTRVTNLKVVAPWRHEGKARMTELRREGLVSGYVWWGFPQHCSSCSISHADLAKDSETTTSGQAKISHLKNISQYGIARFLATEASQEFLRDAFKRWPLLKELNCKSNEPNLSSKNSDCGSHMAFEVLLDRR